jgi:hypothetical protein
MKFRTKLTLETSDCSNLQPILNKWHLIAAKRSLLKVLVPAEGNSYFDLMNAWGATDEVPVTKKGFFKTNAPRKTQNNTYKLESVLEHSTYPCFVGYRRLSYLLPDVIIRLDGLHKEDPNATMHFCNGEVIQAGIDMTILIPLMTTNLGSPDYCADTTPWIPLTKETARKDHMGRLYYLDKHEGKLCFVE